MRINDAESDKSPSWRVTALRGDALVTTKAAVLEEIASGKLDVVKAFLTGKIKVEGNVGKAALLKDIPVKIPAKAEKGKNKKK